MITRHGRLSKTDKKYIFGIIAFGVLGFFAVSLFYLPISSAYSNYYDIQSGSTSENCTIIDYQTKTSIFSKNVVCSLFAVAECSRSQMIVDVNCSRITCNDIKVLNKCMNVKQIGDLVEYISFIRHPYNYFTKIQYDNFIDKYSFKPITQLIIISVFCCVFILIAISGVIMYCVKN